MSRTIINFANDAGFVLYTVIKYSIFITGIAVFLAWIVA